MEDYLRDPYGVWDDRGKAIAAALPIWGEALFDAVIGARMPGSALYGLARDHPQNCQLEFQSASPSFLGLPWELMKDQVRSEPLALEFAGFVRTLPTRQDPFPLREAVSLRVLLVISRPLDHDVGHQIVARPLMRLLPAMNGRVDLDVLRPPTFNQLKHVLRAAKDAGRPYQVVHFDGHGNFGVGPIKSEATQPRGILLFESDGAGFEVVTAEDFATELARAAVPLVVLNACRSATLDAGAGPDATVATRLLRAGAAAVVAMSYSVFAIAAAEFMAVLYGALFSGHSLAEAVAKGRRQLREAPSRPSPKGPLALADWGVPVLYSLHHDIVFPGLEQRTPAIGKIVIDDTDPHHGVDVSNTDLESIESPAPFFGRDREFLALERHMLTRPVVMVHGPAGGGKTELAKAFARWWRDTGGTTESALVFFHSFEPGRASFDLDTVVATVGTELMGTNFLSLSPERRQADLLEQMRRVRLLLVWDNFETVASMPDPEGVTPPLDAEERRQVRDFLIQVARDRHSAIVITSRSPEEWLGHEVARVEIGRLSGEDTDRYADLLLKDVPDATARRADPDFPRLMEHLDGHPLSLRLTLPLLGRQPPGALLAALLGEPVTSEEGADARTRSLSACLTYSLHNLSPRHRSLLPALSLWEGVADAALLADFSSRAPVPDRYRGIDREEWRACLTAAADVGLLTPLGGSSWRIHPALPVCLMAEWRASGDGFAAEWEASRDASIETVVDFGNWLCKQLDTGDGEVALTLLSMQRRTLCRYLDQAMRQGHWGSAQAILHPLNEFWESAGLIGEAKGWCQRIRGKLESPAGETSDLDGEAGALWLFVTGAEAARDLRAGDLAIAGDAYDNLRQVLERRGGESVQFRLAAIYHQLGIIAEYRGDLAAAEGWHRKSLKIHEDRHYRVGIALDQAGLGAVALKRDDLDEADRWFRMSLAIYSDLQSATHMRFSYGQLGTVAQERGDLSAAADWHFKSLAIDEKLGDQPAIAADYGNLGLVALRSGDLNLAESWFRKSLAITEDRGDRSGMASIYGNLGIIAQRRDDLEIAESWLQKALAIERDLGDRSGMASTYGNLGNVALRRGDFDTAENWFEECLVIVEDLHDRSGMQIAYEGLGVVAKGRYELDVAENWFRKSLAFADNLRHRPALASIYDHFVALALDRGEIVTALDWSIRAICLFPDFHSFVANNSSDHSALLTRLVGWPGLEEAWSRVTGDDLPATIRSAMPALVRQSEIDVPDLAQFCRQAGIDAQRRGNLGAAEKWLRKSILIDPENRRGTSWNYYWLGMVARKHGDLEAAEDRLRRSLAISQDLDVLPDMAMIYDELGAVDHERGNLDAAEGWYRESLAIKELLQHTPSISASYDKLWVLAMQRNDHGAALDSAVRANALFSSFPSPDAGVSPRFLARITLVLGWSELEQAWQRITGVDLPEGVRDALPALMSTEREILDASQG